MKEGRGETPLEFKNDILNNKEIQILKNRTKTLRKLLGYI